MIRYFRTFLVAAETASFSAAGARLGLTQSAVSTQIRRLEEELDCILFERTGKSVALSDEGRRLLPDAARIVELFEGMKGAGARRPDLSPIDLGAISTVQSTLLPKALHRFRQAHPSVHVNIVPGMSIQLLTQIDTRELDIAVMIRPRLGLPSDLRWIALMREQFTGIAPDGASGDLRQLAAAQPFIRYNRRSHGGRLVDQFLRKHGLWVRDGMELDEPGVILDMVAEGLGWAIIPGDLVPLSAAGVRILPLPGQSFHREIGVLVRTAAARRPHVEALIESMNAEVAHRGWALKENI